MRQGLAEVLRGPFIGYWMVFREELNMFPVLGVLRPMVLSLLRCLAGLGMYVLNWWVASAGVGGPSLARWRWVSRVIRQRVSIP